MLIFVDYLRLSTFLATEEAIEAKAPEYMLAAAAAAPTDWFLNEFAAANPPAVITAKDTAGANTPGRKKRYRLSLPEYFPARPFGPRQVL